jgi:hypothetical protein
MSGGVAQAVAGAQVGLQQLHPYNQIVRTFVLDTNIVNPGMDVTFDPSFGGRVTLGTGAGAKNVCKDLFDCMGESNPQTLVPLNSNMGGVQPACIANGVNAGCDGVNQRDLFAFNLPASGSPPVCNNPGSVTVDTTICAAEPVDGFPLNVNGVNPQVIVFVYNGNLQATGFQVGAAGFGISGGAVSPCAAAGQVLNAQVLLQSQPFPPSPTSTPSNTPSPTVTGTGTPFGTATATGTITRTPTITNTPEATRTRPGIPVIPSPASPGGLVLIGALAVALIWALQRLQRQQ